MDAKTDANTKYEIITSEGKKARWSGKQVACGVWPDDEGTSIGIYLTDGGHWVAWVTLMLSDGEEEEAVITADSEDELVEILENHQGFCENEYYLGALQNTYPKRDIWV